MSEPPGSAGIRLTARRVIVRSPCCPDDVIVLGRAHTDLSVAHDVTCLSCGSGWKLDFLSDARHGLRAAWRPIAQRRADAGEERP